jgi:hypothetical protein
LNKGGNVANILWTMFVPTSPKAVQVDAGEGYASKIIRKLQSTHDSNQLKHRVTNTSRAQQLKAWGVLDAGMDSILKSTTVNIKRSAICFEDSRKSAGWRTIWRHDVREPPFKRFWNLENSTHRPIGQRGLKRPKNFQCNVV